MKKSKYTRELLEPIIKESYSWAQVLKKLNLKGAGGNLVNIRTKVICFNIPFYHFTGKAWNKGLTAHSSRSIANQVKKISIPNELIFTNNSPHISGVRLKNRLLELGWEYKCKLCGINSWLGNNLILHIDHINGIHNDNRFENIRFLCPNCHQQTDTWGVKTKQNI